MFCNLVESASAARILQRSSRAYTFCWMLDWRAAQRSSPMNRPGQFVFLLTLGKSWLFARDAGNVALNHRIRIAHTVKQSIVSIWKSLPSGRDRTHPTIQKCFCSIHLMSAIIKKNLHCNFVLLGKLPTPPMCYGYTIQLRTVCARSTIHCEMSSFRIHA